jgi:chromosome segregation ATPase
MSDPVRAFEEGRTLCQGLVNDEMHTLIRPLDVLFANRIEKAKSDQQELIAKIESLGRDLESIEGLLPPSYLDEYTTKINRSCDRIDALKRRIIALNRRADTLLGKLAKPKGQRLIP